MNRTPYDEFSPCEDCERCPSEGPCPFEAECNAAWSQQASEQAEAIAKDIAWEKEHEAEIKAYMQAAKLEATC